MTMKWRHCVTDAPWKSGKYALLELLPNGWRWHMGVYEDHEWRFATSLDPVLCWWAPLPQTDPIKASTAKWYRHLYFDPNHPDA